MFLDLSSKYKEGCENIWLLNKSVHEKVGYALSLCLWNVSEVLNLHLLYHFSAASYTPFFKECWDRKPETETAFSFSETDDNTATTSHEHQRLILDPRTTGTMRQHTALPKPPTRKDSVGVGKSSSNRWVLRHNCKIFFSVWSYIIAQWTTESCFRFYIRLWMEENVVGSFDIITIRRK